MRSAQPRTGILQRSCKEDVIFLDAVRKLSKNDLPFMIFDARLVSKIRIKISDQYFTCSVLDYSRLRKLQL